MPHRNDRRWLHNLLCAGLVLLVLAGVAQATHAHGPDLLKNHCSTCVGSQVLAAPIANPPLLIHQAGVVLLVLVASVTLQRRIVASSYTRPPPAL
jgi:hypothetical protein